MKAGSIKFQQNNVKFVWMLSADDNPEVYGFIVGADEQIVPKSSGWFRTTDPELAALIAADRFGYTVQLVTTAESVDSACCKEVTA